MVVIERPGDGGAAINCSQIRSIQVSKSRLAGISVLGTGFPGSATGDNLVIGENFGVVVDSDETFSA
jgi:hypothetical protein